MYRYIDIWKGMLCFIDVELCSTYLYDSFMYTYVCIYILVYI